MFAIDGLGKDSCAGGFPDSSRPAEEVGMSQFPRPYGVEQGGGKGTLADYHVECGRSVLAGRYDVLFHRILIFLNSLQKY